MLLNDDDEKEEETTTLIGWRRWNVNERRVLPDDCVVLVKARGKAQPECLDVFVAAEKAAVTRRLDRPERN